MDASKTLIPGTTISEEDVERRGARIASSVGLDGVAAGNEARLFCRDVVPALLAAWREEKRRAEAAEAKLRAVREELEEAILARGRLRLWLEFIHLNSDAKEFTGAALTGEPLPEGFLNEMDT